MEKKVTDPNLFMKLVLTALFESKDFNLLDYPTLMMDYKWEVFEFGGLEPILNLLNHYEINKMIGQYYQRCCRNS